MHYSIVNANIVLPNEIIKDASLTIENGCITDICGSARGDTFIDAEGMYLLPGIIDIHSDHIEQVIEPRTGAVMDVSLALHEQEKQLVNNGITSMYHSLSLWRGGTKAARGEVFPELIESITNLNNSECLISHYLHIRFDITNFDAIPGLMEILEDTHVSLLSFMDHTPGQGQYRDLDRQKANLLRNNPTMSDEEIEERLRQRMETPKIPKEELEKIADFAKSKGISIASHDDDSVDKIDFVKDSLHATISEFPVELEVARYAKEAGLATLGGAPNVMLGKSTSGNLSASEGVVDGSITTLCSDYYPPAMLQAVFKLHMQFGLPLHDCVNLVTLAPAKAVGIDTRTGSIEIGKAADLILVDENCKPPRLVTAITNGNIVSTLKYSQISLPRIARSM